MKSSNSVGFLILAMWMISQIAAKDIYDVKWTTCSGLPPDFMVVDQAFVYGDIQKGGVFTMRMIGTYLQDAIIEVAQITVKYGFLTVMDEEIYRPTVCTKDRQFDISKSALFPLEPLDGGYKVTFRYFNEIGIEKGCWLINFKIK